MQYSKIYFHVNALEIISMTVFHIDPVLYKEDKCLTSLFILPPKSVFSPVFFVSTNLWLPIHVWWGPLSEAWAKDSTWVSATHHDRKRIPGFWRLVRFWCPLPYPMLVLLKPTSLTPLKADFQHSLNNWDLTKRQGSLLSPTPGTVICWLVSATNLITSPHHLKIPGSLSFLPFPNQ